jgi:hypothetical protein
VKGSRSETRSSVSGTAPALQSRAGMDGHDRGRSLRTAHSRPLVGRIVLGGARGNDMAGHGQPDGVVNGFNRWLVVHKRAPMRRAGRVILETAVRWLASLAGVQLVRILIRTIP